MTRDQIIQFARQAANRQTVSASDMADWPVIERFAALVAAHEREECAKVCQEESMRCESAAQVCIDNGEKDEVVPLRSTAWKLSVCASRIKARGNNG